MAPRLGSGIRSVVLLAYTQRITHGRHR